MRPGGRVTVRVRVCNVGGKVRRRHSQLLFLGDAITTLWAHTLVHTLANSEAGLNARHQRRSNAACSGTITHALMFKS